MWKYREATNLLTCLLLLSVLSAHLLEAAQALSGKRLCADELCRGVISLGRGKIGYVPGERGMIPFKMNSVIRIKSKGVDKDNSLYWGIEVGGREGTAPKDLILENKILVSEKQLILVDDEPQTKVPDLLTSEKLVEQGSTLEAATTEPLTITPAASPAELLNKNSNEKISAENLPVATPVVSEMVDGTKVPLYRNDENGNDDKSQDEEQSDINNVVDGNEQVVQDKIEALKMENKSGPEKYKNDERQTSEMYKQQAKQDGANVRQEEKANSKETYRENAFRNEETLSKREYSLGDQTNNSNKLESGKEEQLHPGENVTTTTSVTDEKAEYENSTQQIKEGEPNVSEERQQTENTNAKQENETNLNKTDSESAFETEEDIVKSTAKLSKETEAEKTETISSETPNVFAESLIGEQTAVNGTFNSSYLAEHEQKANALDDVNRIETHSEEEIKKSEETVSKDTANVISEIPTADITPTNQSTFKIDDLAGTEQNYNDDSSTNTYNLQNSETPKDSQGESAKPEFNSIHKAGADNTNSSITAPDQKLPNDDDNKLNNDLRRQSGSVTETIGTNKIDSEKEQIHKENPIPQWNIYNETVSNNTNVSSEGKVGYSSDKEAVTASSESNIQEQSDKHQKTDEDMVNSGELQKTTEKIITTEYIATKPAASANDIEKSSKENNSNKVSPSAALENGKIDDRTTSNKHVDESSSVIIEDSNPANAHNQHKINNEVHQGVPLQQTNEDALQQFDNIHSFPTESVPYYKESTTTETAKNDLATESTSYTNEASLNTIYQTSIEMQGPAEIVESINPTTSSPMEEHTPLPIYQEDMTTISPPNNNYAHHFDHSQEISNSIGSAPKNDEATKSAPSLATLEQKETKGLFATIMGTVNNMLTNNKKKQNEFDGEELDRILFSQGNAQKNDIEKITEETSFPYCKNIEPNGDCPESSENHDHLTSQFHHTASKFLLGSDLTMEAFLTTMAAKILEMSELIAFLGIAAAASLFFVFGYYCFCNSSREGALLLKLNQLESSLLASHKENAILKHNLMSTRQKLASIEDNSFGSNDMVVSLKKELEEELLEKARLQEQITVLQKELENAADAGIELNKIVSELLSNQTGDESIISSVEELQKQLNEQQNTIYEINASLAEKSRENSELQLMIAEQNARYEAELANVQRDNDELEHEKGNLLSRLEEMKTDFDKDITVALEGKNMEIKRLQNDILDLNNNLENEHTKWQTSVAKIEALEECLKNVRRDPKVNISEVIDVANVKAQHIEAQKMYKSLKERFETELDSRKLVENQLEVVSAEVEKLKQDFNQSEKDKLEAQTRLEVLSNYFKDKENQLQKELSLKEAMWLKQQGETTTTVDRVTAMQEEIQSLKSQNDSLRAEVEAQLAAHKAQIGTLENRAHETWLAARQSDRRCEEARAEATALRRKLTALAGGGGGGAVNESNKPPAGPAALEDELTQAPSPIHMESPGSPLLMRMPPPPFLPPPFMGPPPPFMGMPPPPPFVPPGEMRPAPLGRIMSPPPQRSGRFSPQHVDYDDYLDYEGNNTWQRYTYSPPPRTYRSLSPTDSRYNYGTERDLISTYDTETDFSPPPSPRESRRRAGNSSERVDSNTKISYGNTKNLNSSNKGPLSSGSENSFNTHSHNDTKTRKGNTTVGGKNLV